MHVCRVQRCLVLTSTGQHHPGFTRVTTTTAIDHFALSTSNLLLRYYYCCHPPWERRRRPLDGLRPSWTSCEQQSMVLLRASRQMAIKKRVAPYLLARSSHQHPLNHSRADDDKASSDKQRAITNPFEVHRNASTKHTVLGRRVRGAERNVALARSRVTTATTHNQHSWVVPAWLTIAKMGLMFAGTRSSQDVLTARV